MAKHAWVALALLVSTLAGCGGDAAPASTRPASMRPAAPSIAGAPDRARLTPEQAEQKARGKAREWQQDAWLVGVIWAVPKLELSSTVFHVFRSKRVGELMAVETRLTTWWQKPHVVDDPKITLPARALAELAAYPIDARRALAIAKAQLPPGQDRPLALLVEGRALLGPPLWGVQLGFRATDPAPAPGRSPTAAETARVLIDARTGAVLVGEKGLDVLLELGARLTR